MSREGGESGEVRNPRFISSEFDTYSPEAAQLLRERISEMSYEKVANFLKDNSKFFGDLTLLTETLQHEYASKKDILKALSEIEKAYAFVETSTGNETYTHLGESMGIAGKQDTLDAMRHFLNNKAREIDQIEKNLGYAMRGLNQNFPMGKLLNKKIDISDASIKTLKKLEDGLSKIHKESVMDTRLSYIKNPEYENKLKELIDSLA